MAAVCECDDCGRKSSMLKGLQLTAALLPSPDPAMAQTIEELQAALAQHLARAEEGRRRRGGEEALNTFKEASCQRPWLDYNPDAFLPSPFDTFLLSGVCPPLQLQLQWPKKPKKKKKKNETTRSEGLPPGPAEGHCTMSGIPRYSLDNVDLDICFIVGCGRSGTTVLADILSHHSDVLLLNEPRQLWIPHLPAMDIWSVDAHLRAGKLAFEPGEVTSSLVEEMRDEYLRVVAAFLALRAKIEDSDAERSVGGECPSRRRIVLLEKLPEHCFRMPFLANLCSRMQLFRSCKFLHVVRGGVAVARSIAAFQNPAAWYGVKAESKWKALQALKECRPGGAAAFCKALTESAGKALRGRFGRGLLEWVLSEAFAREARQLHAEGDEAISFLEVQYEDLSRQPAQVITQALAFCGLGNETQSASSSTDQKGQVTAADCDPPTKPEVGQNDVPESEVILGDFVKQPQVGIVQRASEKVMRPITNQKALSAEEETAVACVKAALEAAGTEHPTKVDTGTEPSVCEGDCGKQQHPRLSAEHIAAIQKLLSSPP